ncbi:MAG TPA: helix-turn-helix domain-containing protein [Actinophytocola sp.]|uniref:ArsR/SmtB family transcription factor n=1 Tax=Actinophytocola sp. TaxID=1872138 RepID=UPI002DDD6289|nr:helix-turn-helix domain-containing protein [Actinophytocola sp.]HEV2780548.1 helix-turn-helix domain-containing protein [Actinophytocola sp.]
MNAERRSVELDGRTLRALAHPLRAQMLGLLRTEGPATATGLAARVGESSGTTSWHLRQLAEAGLVEEAPDRGSRRERWWRAAHLYTMMRLEKLVDEPDNAELFNVFLHEVASTYYRKAAAFLSQAGTWGREWLESADFSDDELPLTAPELVRLTKELHEIVARYKRERRPGDERVVVQLQLFPRRPS